MRSLKYIAAFLLGLFVAKFWCQWSEESHQKEEIQVVVNGIKDLSKLVVSEGTFSEIYNYSDSKKYFFDLISFNKKAMITVNANVEVGYDLSKIDIQIDSIAKKIIINTIPKEEIRISPDIKYFDLQQSRFNKFSREELNKMNQKSIQKIRETVEVAALQKEAQKRLFEELSKIYQLSAVFQWEVVNNTKSDILTEFPMLKN